MAAGVWKTQIEPLKHKQELCIRFAGAAVTKPHNPGGCNRRSVLSRGSGEERSRGRQAWFLLGAVGENLPHACPPAAGGRLAVCGIPWLVDVSPSLRLYLHTRLCVYMALSKFPFLRTPVIRLGAHSTLVGPCHNNKLRLQ